MSYVEKRIDGRYEVGIRCQDGYDRTTCATEAEAIEAYKSGIHWLSGTRTPVESIPDPVILDKAAWPVVGVDDSGGLMIHGSEVHSAIKLAIHQQLPDPGSRYEFRVVLVKVGGGETYIGAGI